MWQSLLLQHAVLRKACSALCCTGVLPMWWSLEPCMRLQECP
jgi:hypothetical protein